MFFVAYCKYAKKTHLKNTASFLRVEKKNLKQKSKKLSNKTFNMFKLQSRQQKLYKKSLKFFVVDIAMVS